LQIPRIGDFNGVARAGVGGAVIWWESHQLLPEFQISCERATHPVMAASERVAGPKDECRLGAVSDVDCRPMYRDMPVARA